MILVLNEDDKVNYMDSYSFDFIISLRCQAQCSMQNVPSIKRTCPQTPAPGFGPKRAGRHGRTGQSMFILMALGRKVKDISRVGLDDPQRSLPTPTIL